jgi:tetratricopeptide (TPR) repeat protein
MLSYLYRQNRYTVSEEHLDYARTVLKSARETGKLNEVAAAQFRLGFSLLWYQDFDKAEQQLLECLEVAGRIDDVILKARCLTYLSVICRRRGQIDRTQYYLNQLEETLNALNMNEYEGVCKANQGWVQWQQGKTEEAVENLKRGLAFWSGQVGKKAPAYPFRWLALWPLISISLAANNTNQAFEYSRELLGPDQQIIPQDLKLILEQIHHNYVQGNLDETTRLLKQAVEEAKAKRYL